MVDDLVKWLREYGNRNGEYECCRAADRIEQLEIEEKRSYRNLTHAIKHIEKLEAALREIASLSIICASDIAIIALRRKALEGKDE